MRVLRSSIRRIRTVIVILSGSSNSLVVNLSRGYGSICLRATSAILASICVNGENGIWYVFNVSRCRTAFPNVNDDDDSIIVRTFRHRRVTNRLGKAVRAGHSFKGGCHASLKQGINCCNVSRINAVNETINQGPRLNCVCCLLAIAFVAGHVIVIVATEYTRCGRRSTCWRFVCLRNIVVLVVMCSERIVLLYSPCQVVRG